MPRVLRVTALPPCSTTSLVFEPVISISSVRSVGCCGISAIGLTDADVSFIHDRSPAWIVPASVDAVTSLLKGTGMDGMSADAISCDNSAAEIGSSAEITMVCPTTSALAEG
jgi:hypothetical protein